jgi:polyhydroxyalkanoate synthesis regulator phasin
LRASVQEEVEHARTEVFRRLAQPEPLEVVLRWLAHPERHEVVLRWLAHPERHEVVLRRLDRLAHPERPKSSSGGSTGASAERRATSGAGAGDSLASIVEQLINRVIKPLDLVVLTRERIQETLDEAAERGRVTRSDANELVGELVRRGRQQTDDLFRDVELLLERGRDQLDSATRRARLSEPAGMIVRSADRVRRTVGTRPALPIVGYDELTAGQVVERVEGLTRAELRTVRDYERRHANRKSVLAAVEKALP